MAYRNVRKEDLEGKAIEKVECDAVNVVKLTFTDGTKLELWAETVVSTEYGGIAGLQVSE